MSDLFGSLTSAAHALQVQQLGLDVAGQNIANANTAGYSRRQLELTSIPPSTQRSAGGGVDVVAIRSIRDMFLEGRLRLERPAEEREAALADCLSVVEAALGTPGDSIDGQLTAFFDAWASLSQDPTSATMRQSVIVQAQSLSAAFNDMASRLDQARRGADSGVRSTVDDVNQLVQRIASLNDAIARAGGGAMALSLQDDQAEAIKSLSELVDIDVLQNDSGGVDVSFGNGRPLAIGGNAYPVDVTSNAQGFAVLRSGDSVVTNEITGGRLAGLLAARDVAIPDYQGKLDTLAFTLAQEINAQHVAGYDLNGASGGAFFSAGVLAGAAAALGVDSTLASDARLVAAASATSGADNGNARAIAALRGARVIDGNTATFNDSWAQLAYTVGQDSVSARSEQRSRAEIVSQIDALRDAVSGVSLDQEAAMMMRFQRAYEANARYFATVNTALDTLMQMVGN